MSTFIVLCVPIEQVFQIFLFVTFTFNRKQKFLRNEV